MLTKAEILQRVQARRNRRRDRLRAGRKFGRVREEIELQPVQDSQQRWEALKNETVPTLDPRPMTLRELRRGSRD